MPNISAREGQPDKISRLIFQQNQLQIYSNYLFIIPAQRLINTATANSGASNDTTVKSFNSSMPTSDISTS